MPHLELMGSPKQLTRPHLAALASRASGEPLEQRKIRVGADGKCSMILPMRENDVYLLNLRASLPFLYS